MSANAHLDDDSLQPEHGSARWDPRNARKELAELRLKYGGDDWLVTALLETMREVRDLKRTVKDLDHRVT